MSTIAAMTDQARSAAELIADATQPKAGGRDRMLDAAREEIVSHGIARTSVAAIAQRAGVSRPTLYRQCGDKDQIVAAVAQREVVDFFTRASLVIGGLRTAEEKLVEAFVMGMREAREHPVVGALRDFETDSFTRRLVEMDTPPYRSVISVAAALLSDSANPPSIMEVALDISLRITATFLISPSPYSVTGDDDSARAFGQRFLIPILHAARATLPAS